MAGSKFNRLVRFKSFSGEVYHGEVEEKAPTADQLIGKSVRVYKGHNPWDDDFTLSEEKEEIAEVSGLRPPLCLLSCHGSCGSIPLASQ